MAGFFQKLKVAGTVSSSSKSKTKDESTLDLTPVERLLQNAGPIRDDGKKFVEPTVDRALTKDPFPPFLSYCNSILQALYYSEPFRESVVNYPLLPPDDANGGRKKVNVTIRPPVQTPPKDGKGKAGSAQAKQRQVLGGGQLAPGMSPVRPEDRPDAPEYKKKQAMIKGPVLELAQENPGAYGMEECTFTGLKDIFTALIESGSRTGVLSPQRFLDIFKRDNEMFRNSMHQDAHEFYGLILNDVIANVEANAKRMQELAQSRNQDGNGEPQAIDTVVAKSNAAAGTRMQGAGWVHDIFEGVLTSETRCLTCETTSQRDETFLDLSIDLEEHSSVTSCLQKFSAEEMLCERNKFHCDHCGGLQEAEKRMKVKKLPKVMALHLKRFKYTEDYSRLQKLFHRIVYPYHIRMFNTTDDAEDQDRMYELYAVVIHIGGNAYHGHYVAVIKTKDKGWLLFDDEMVEPVDKHFVKNFFGDKPGMACAYVLFYQETTWEKVREEMDAEGMEQVKEASLSADLAAVSPTTDQPNGNHTIPLLKLSTQPLPIPEEDETLAALDHAKTAPVDISNPVSPTSPLSAQPEIHTHPLVAAPPPAPAVMTKGDEAATKSKEDKSREKKEQKELKAQEKARKAAEKAAEKEQAKQLAKEKQERLDKLREATSTAEDEKRRKRAVSITADSAVAAGHGANGDTKDTKGSVGSGFFNLAGRSMTRKSLAFLKNPDKDHKTDKSVDNKTEHRSDRSEASESRASTAGGESNSNGHHSNDQAPPIPQIPMPYQNGTNGTTSNGHATGATTASSSSSASPFLASILGGPTRSDTAPELGNSPKPGGLKERFSFGLGKKRSGKFLSSLS
ncbi:hypothetical protein QBC38DRAFT_358774 [Podospora fimiseda]|uniref:ubiquitinyl hydrolase 1 n=1 Tax=Podospora fimiseda TaxID=252190 RepID=A0AAN7BUM5_9PEZI|nr:hypothetical protein QBC38DRAFT_358774 [Podospora fimiseda]